MGRVAANLKLPEWATKIATWAFMAVVGAGFSVYMDTAVHSQEIATLKKDVERISGEIRSGRELNDEATRKSLEKLDRVIFMIERTKQ